MVAPRQREVGAGRGSAIARARGKQPGCPGAYTLGRTHLLFTFTVRGRFGAMGDKRGGAWPPPRRLRPDASWHAHAALRSVELSEAEAAAGFARPPRDGADQPEVALLAAPPKEERQLRADIAELQADAVGAPSP